MVVNAVYIHIFYAFMVYIFLNVFDISSMLAYSFSDCCRSQKKMQTSEYIQFKAMLFKGQLYTIFVSQKFQK